MKGGGAHQLRLAQYGDQDFDMLGRPVFAGLGTAQRVSGLLRGQAIASRQRHVLAVSRCQYPAQMHAPAIIIDTKTGRPRQKLRAFKLCNTGLKIKHVAIRSVR